MRSSDAEELKLLVDSLGCDLDRLKSALKEAELREQRHKENAAWAKQRIQEQELRIHHLKQAGYTAIGKLHVIHSAAASVVHWRKRYLEHPDELTERMTCIIDSRLIAHDALAADGRIQEAQNRLGGDESGVQEPETSS